MLNGIKIQIVEGSEILKNNLDKKSIKLQYKGIFADSLLLDKLIDYKIKINEKEHSTRDIIMLNFSYGYNSKEIKNISKEIEKLKNEVKSLLEQKKENIELRKTQKTNKDKKTYTTKIDNIAQDIKEIKAIIKEKEEYIKVNKMDKESVREKLYIDGFYLDYYKKDKQGNITKDTIEYVFWFRTPSKSRVGDAIFINKKLYNKINRWQTMDIELQKDENGKVKKVEMEAYKSLTASHIERKIYIPVDSILIVNDLTSFIKTQCSEVHYHVADEENNPTDTEDMCYVINGENEVKSTLWDGMMLLDKEYCGDNQFMLLRNHYFKACAFNSNIKQFFIDYCKENGLDYDTYAVQDRYGNMMPVKSIVGITTENAMKFEKLFNNKIEGYKSWVQHVKADGELFGICKVNHESKYGEYQRTSYQHINSLPINIDGAIDLVDDTKKVVEAMKKDNELFIKHLERTASEMNNNNMMIDLYRHNKDFAATKPFRSYKTKTISEYKETLRAGKLLTIADNLTVCGNPYMLLLHSVGALNKYINGNIISNYEDDTLPKLNNGYASCYTKRFDNELLTAFRNPHNSFANILKLQNKRINPIMDKYFKFGGNVIALNMLNTDLQERANSMDEDSDFIYCTNNSVINKALADKDYPCIVNCIDESKKTYEDNNKELARIDNGLAESKNSIGLSSNIAQLALSWYWKNPSKELEDIVSIASILAQCSIDNSKRQYSVNLNREIDRIRKLDCMQEKTEDGLSAKPYFWQFVKEIKEKERKYEEIKSIKKSDKEQALANKIKAKTEAKKIKNDKVEDLEKHCISKKVCPMDFIQEGIDTIENDTYRDPYLDIFKLIKNIDGKAKKEQMDKIMDLVKGLDDIYKKQNDNDNNNKMDKEEFAVYSMIKTDEIINKIKSYSIKNKNMEMLIRNTLCLNKTRKDSVENNSKYRLRLLNCLYKAHKEVFLSVWVKK